MWNFIARFRAWAIFILLALIATLVSLTIYVSVQQSYRMSANDPQIEVSQGIADALNQGAPPESIIGGNGFDISNNLSAFGIIFDKDGKVVVGSGKLNGSVPTPPKGIFTYLQKHNSERFTWQPQKGVRIAAVIQKLDGDKGFVLVGRSLKEIESRIDRLGLIVGIAWIGLLILSALLAWVLAKAGSSVAIIEENILVEAAPEGTETVSLE